MFTVLKTYLFNDIITCNVYLEVILCYRFIVFIVYTKLSIIDSKLSNVRVISGELSDDLKSFRVKYSVSYKVLYLQATYVTTGVKGFANI